MSYSMPDFTNPYVAAGLLVVSAGALVLIIRQTRTHVDPKLQLDLQGTGGKTALQMHYSVPRHERSVPNYPGRQINHDLSNHPAVKNLKTDPARLMKQGYELPVYSNRKIDPVHLGLLKAAQDSTPTSEEVIN